MQTNDMEFEVLSEEEKRENRRRRRVRNERLAYFGLFMFLLILVGGIVGGIFLADKYRKKEKQEPEENQEIVQEIENVSDNSALSENDIQQEEDTVKEVLDEVVDAVISEMTLEEKVAGLFLVTPEAITGVDTAVQAGEGTKKALEKYPVGGLIYFSKNIKSEEQIKQMAENSKTYCKYPLFIAVDEEGGKVARLAESLNLENVGNMSEIGAGGDASAAYDAMKRVGGYMSEYGFNLNFAPVADVLLNEKNTSILERSFGEDPAVVAQMVTSSIEGLKEAGITACVKHFPGLGDTTQDTHDGLVVIDKSLEELKQAELVPFAAAVENGAEMIMVGHVSLPQICGENVPATMSKEIISDLLRSELGFNGVVITDAMNMKSIMEYYGADEAAIRAFRAGADMILMPEDFELAYKGVLGAVQDGTISEERIDDSLKRVFRIKYKESVGE